MRRGPLAPLLWVCYYAVSSFIVKKVFRSILFLCASSAALISSSSSSIAAAFAGLSASLFLFAFEVLVIALALLADWRLLSPAG